MTSHDGDRLLVATGGDDRTVRVWDGERGVELAALEEALGEKTIMAVAFARLGGSPAVIATRASWFCVGWELATLLGGPPDIARDWASRLAVPDAHMDTVRGLAVLRDDDADILYSVGDDRLLARADLARGTVTRRERAHADWIIAVCTAEIGGHRLVITGGRTAWSRSGGMRRSCP